MAVYTQENTSQELQEKLVQILTTLISVLALSRRTIKHGRTWGFGRNILLGDNDRVDAAVARLDKLTQSESRLVGAETLTESKRVGRTLDDMVVTVTASNAELHSHGTVLSSVNLDIKAMRREFDQLAQTMNEVAVEATEEKDQKHRDKLKEILRPSVSAQDLYDHMSKKRVAGTGEWIRDEPLFQAWVGRKVPLLWVTGTPGAGKSYLSANIISILRDANPQGMQSTAHVSVGYFFFKDSNPETRSFLQALRDLAYQISQNDSVYAKHMCSSCQSQDDIKTIRSAWRKLYVDFFVRGGDLDSSVYLILDGVDEAYDAERKVFLELLNDLKTYQSDKPTRIQLAMVGRPQLLDELAQALEEDYLPTIHVNGDKTSNDIIQYIQTSIHKSKTLKLISQDLKDQVVATLSQNAQGMFIWVDFMLQELYKKKRPGAILDALKRAPKGLNEMLRHVLESFSATLQDEDPEDLNELLAWVTCVGRPLKLGELDMILKLRSATGEGLLSLEDSMRTQFAAFFSLTRQDGLTTADLQHISAQELRNLSDTENEEFEEQDLDVAAGATYYNSDPSTTEITFCHASVGDFFRDESEGPLSAGEGFPLVGVAFNEAKVSVCQTCLGLLCDEDMRNKNQNGVSMVPYAFGTWYDHLKAINLSTTTIQSKQAIGIYLTRMFRDKDLLPSWAGGVPSGFFCNEYLLLIRRWLEDPEVSENLSVEDRNWVRETANSPASIFMAVASYIATRWLQDVFWLPKNCFYILYAAIELMRGNAQDTNPPASITASEILRVAEWAGFPKNALWHRRVAMAMRECELYDAAVEHFEKSLDLETSEFQPTTWLARGGLAMVYLLRKDWRRATELDKITERAVNVALETASENEAVSHKKYLHAIQERMAECYGNLRDRKSALNYFQAAFRNEKYCYKCASHCASELMKAKQYAGLISMMIGMQDKLPQKEHTRLDEFFCNHYLDDDRNLLENSTIAARETDNVQVLAEVLHNALLFARRELKTVAAIDLEVQLAQLYYRDLDEVDKAIHIWNRLVRTFQASSKAETVMGIARQAGIENLAIVYFQRVMETPRGSSEQSLAVRSLERLIVIKRNAIGETTEIATTTQAGHCLGSWYRLNGQTSEAHACFKAYLKIALRMLSDDDPENDMEGYLRLGDVLLSAGHDASAIAVFQALYSATEPKTQIADLDVDVVDVVDEKGEGGNEADQEEFDEVND